VDAPDEWNYEEYEGTTDEELMEWIEKILLKHSSDSGAIDEYIDQIFSYGDPEAYDNITEKELLDDFNQWYEEDYSNNFNDWGLNTDDDF
jgi:hypothetical protein